jgi:hypothetical protein
MLQRIYSEKQKLDYLFLLISRVENEELKSHYAKYLCVLVSGFIENSLKTIFSEYVKNRSHVHIINYVQNNIKYITSLNEDSIAQLLGSFNNDWYQIFKSTVSDSQKDALDSVVANRHLIVHGRTVGLTYIRIKVYFEHIVETIQFIENLVFS